MYKQILLKRFTTNLLCIIVKFFTLCYFILFKILLNCKINYNSETSLNFNKLRVFKIVVFKKSPFFELCMNKHD